MSSVASLPPVTAQIFPKDVCEDASLFHVRACALATVYCRRAYDVPVKLLFSRPTRTGGGYNVGRPFICIVFVPRSFSSGFSQRRPGVRHSTPESDFDDEADDLISSSSFSSEDEEEVGASRKPKRQNPKEKDLFFSGVFRGAAAPKEAVKKLQELCTSKSSSRDHEKIALRGSGDDSSRFSSTEERPPPSELLSSRTCVAAYTLAGGAHAPARTVRVPLSPTAAHSGSSSLQNQTEDDAEEAGAAGMKRTESPLRETTPQGKHRFSHHRSCLGAKP